MIDWREENTLLNLPTSASLGGLSPNQWGVAGDWGTDHTFFTWVTLYKAQKQLPWQPKKAQWVHRGVHWSRKNIYEHTHRYNEWNKGESDNYDMMIHVTMISTRIKVPYK